MLGAPREMDASVTGCCRVCATADKPLAPILFHQDQDVATNALLLKIEVCLRLVVREGDPLPKSVCSTCVSRLDVSYELLQACARGQEELQARLTSRLSSQSTDTCTLRPRVKQEASDSDSESTTSEPTLARLQALDPRTWDSSGPCTSSQTCVPGTCTHSSTRSCEACEVARYGSLPLLVEVIEQRAQLGYNSDRARIASLSVASSSSNIIGGNVDASSMLSETTSLHQQAAGSSSSRSGGSSRQIKCEFCAKVFHHTGDLNKHRRCHTGERPYVCTDCGKKFAHVSNLIRHNKTHTGEKPYPCSSCQRTFSRKDKLHIHTCTGPKPP